MLLSVTPSSPRSMACPVLAKMRLAVIWLPTEVSRRVLPTTTPGPPLSVIRLPATPAVPPIVLPELESISTPSLELPSATVPVASVPILLPATTLSFDPEETLPKHRRSPGRDLDSVGTGARDHVSLVANRRAAVRVDPDPVA